MNASETANRELQGNAEAMDINERESRIGQGRIGNTQ